MARRLKVSLCKIFCNYCLFPFFLMIYISAIVVVDMHNNSTEKGPPLTKNVRARVKTYRKQPESRILTPIPTPDFDFVGFVQTAKTTPGHEPLQTAKTTPDHELLHTVEPTPDHEPLYTVEPTPDHEPLHTAKTILDHEPLYTVEPKLNDVRVVVMPSELPESRSDLVILFKRFGSWILQTDANGANTFSFLRLMERIVHVFATICALCMIVLVGSKCMGMSSNNEPASSVIGYIPRPDEVRPEHDGSEDDNTNHISNSNNFEQDSYDGNGDNVDDDDLVCAICHDTLAFMLDGSGSSPLQLPCGHLMCSICVMRYDVHNHVSFFFFSLLIFFFFFLREDWPCMTLCIFHSVRFVGGNSMCACLLFQCHRPRPHSPGTQSSQ
jgi:hypothetical protein